MAIGRSVKKYLDEGGGYLINQKVMTALEKKITVAAKEAGVELTPIAAIKIAHEVMKYIDKAWDAGAKYENSTAGEGIDWPEWLKEQKLA